MTERQKKILELVELKKSIFELKYYLNLNDKEIIRTINSLKSQGYNIEDKFSITLGATTNVSFLLCCSKNNIFSFSFSKSSSNIVD